MAICVYTIKLPGGEEIKLSAGFNTLEQDKVIDKYFENYFKENNEEKKIELFNNLSSILREKVTNKIHGNTINNVIKNSNSIEELYQTLNNLIYKLGTYENINEAVKNYLFNNRKEPFNVAVSKLLNELKKPRSGKYFEDIGITGLLGTSSLKEERNRIFSLNLENKEFGFSTALTSNLNNFLNNLISKYPDTRDNQVLYGSRDSFIGKSWTSEGLIMYELEDDLSLFSALFKREAVKINPEKLAPIIENLNKIVKFKKYGKLDLDNFDINNFFIGEIIDGKIKTSQFEQLLEKAENKNISKEIDAIINLVAKEINPKSTTLASSMKSLFWQYSPNSYGKNNLFTLLQNLKLIQEEVAFEKDYKETKLSFTEMSSETRDDYYSPTKTIFDNVYEEAVEKITPFVDIVKFPVNKISIFGIVTNIFKRPEGVIVYGVYKNQFGELENLKHIFKNGELQYKKREELLSPFVSTEVIPKNAGILIHSEEPMSDELIKQFIKKGDLVNGQIVVGIYPGYLYLETPTSGKRTKNFYSKIKSISSENALEIIEREKGVSINPNKHIQIKNGDNLLKGDYFLFQEKNNKFYKYILYTDENNVYSWVPTKDNSYIIKGTPKKGLVGLRGSIENMTKEEFDIITAESSIIGKSKATMSSFTDKKIAQKGDYFYSNSLVGKVLEDKKVLLYKNGNLESRTVDSIDNLSEITFLTNRDISSIYALFTTRINNNLIKFQETAGPLDVELIYTVPKNTNLDTLTILPSNYADIGTYKQKEFFKKEEEDNITDFIKKKLGIDQKMLVLGEKKSSENNIWKKNLSSVTEIKYFNELSTEVKKELNILTPGTYFSLYLSKESNLIDRNIYRVISNEDGLVKAQLNKLVNGKFITTEIDIHEDQLLSPSSTEGSIAHLYIINGNRKMPTIFSKINKNFEEKNPVEASKKSINSLIKKLKNYIKDLDAEIKIVPEKGNFNKGEKAKIEVDEKGKLFILINENLGQTEDVLHEFLHLFLIPLRYKYPEIYYSFIKSIVTEDLNVTDAEEVFVKFISEKMITQEDFLNNFEDLNSFVQGLQTILVDIDAEFSISKSDDPITLLKTPLMDLFKIDKKDNNHPLYNLSMITTEPMMRDWMKKNNITLKCN